MPELILAHSSESLPLETGGEVQFARRHINPDGSLGGWLYPQAIVDPTAWVHPGAIVLGGVSIGPDRRVAAPILVSDDL